MKKIVILFSLIGAILISIIGYTIYAIMGITSEYEIPDYIDLTLFSDTLLYAEVYNIQAEPEKYISKTIKMSGEFAIYEDLSNNITYYGCLVMDDEGCCIMGMDFILEDGKNYPDDYPKIGDVFTIEGELQIYEEDGYTYCHIINAVLI